MPRMGRRRTRNLGLPPHMRQAGKAFYYDTQARPRKWIPLGSDYAKALAAWARLEGRPVPVQAETFAALAKWYRQKFGKPAADGTFELPRDTERDLAAVELVFGASPFETITPADVKTYLTGRMSRKRLKEGEQPQPAPVRANREIARLSHAINAAREHGLTSMANPCTGVTRNGEAGRTRYPEHEEFDAVYEAGDALLRDAMDLLYFTGQRPGDTVKTMRRHIVDGALRVRQAKTGTMVPIEVSGELKEAIDRMLSRPRAAVSAYLIADANGQPLTYWQLERRWAAARAAAAAKMPSVADLQMRDLRGKAATDADDLAHAQALLGHKTRAMTEKYVKARAGTRVKPISRRKKA
jgi:integrase